MSAWCPRCGSTRVSGHASDYMCGACHFVEEVSERWGTWEDLSDSANRTWPADRFNAHVPVRPTPLRNDALHALVLDEPDSDDARSVYADWCHDQPSEHARDACDFIHGQLALARAWRTDPGGDPARLLARYRHAFAAAGDAWWRYPSAGVADELAARLRPFTGPEVIADLWFVRGFVEHVAIHAKRFLELADRLFAAAPIRHLTLIHCTGPDHDNEMLFDRLIASPHLSRIRSLQLPGRRIGEPGMLLNRIETPVLARLAKSPHLGELAYLEVRDQWRVDRAVLEQFASLRSLRSARWVTYRYPRSGAPIVIEDRSIGTEPVRTVREVFGT